MINEWDKLGVFRTLWSKVMERSFEVIVETQYAINANSVYIIQWILMQLVKSDSCMALMCVNVLNGVYICL